MEHFETMWQELGLDLKTHDALLNILGQAYQDIYLSQKKRPDSVGYFDAAVAGIHSARIEELRHAQAKGRKVVGSYCVFVPEEIVVAADAIAVGLCSGADFATDEVDKLLPRNTCALIKSALGFRLGKVCPYLESADMVVGENTCDGKKKAYETLGEMLAKKNLYVMDMPQMKSEGGLALLRSEYKKFLRAVEELTGVEITVERLKEGIRIVNTKREALRRFHLLRAAAPAPISGLDALLINQVATCDDPLRFAEALNAICDELEARIAAEKGVAKKETPRILVSGCPMAVPNWKLPFIVETNGAVIVGEESCVGERGWRNLVDGSGDTIDALLDAITERYFKVDCAIFTPNPDRLEHVKEMAEKYNADGVIHYGLQFCQPYLMEAVPMEKALEDDDIPCLRIETDYSMEDAGQLKTRVEAFVEQLR